MLSIPDLVKQFRREKSSEWSKCTIQEVDENVLKDWKDDKNVRLTKINFDIFFAVLKQNKTWKYDDYSNTLGPVPACEEDCGLGEWGEWSECSQSCGQDGVQVIRKYFV